MANCIEIKEEEKNVVKVLKENVGIALFN